MRALSKCLGLLVATAALASCGGGGGSGSHSAFEPTTSGSFSVTATTRQLPQNPNGVLPFPGSPYTSEVTITWRRPSGDLQLGQKISVAIAPVQVAAFSTLDDPATADKNETQILLGSGPVDATNGVATVFVTSGSIAGTATLTISGKDPSSNQTITSTVNFDVVNAAPRVPASVVMGATPRSVYLNGTGGGSSSQVSALVTDGGGQNIPDPVAGNSAFNNVQFEIVGPTGSGSLSAVGAGGGAQSGTVVKTRTVQGVAAVSYSPGTVQGPVQIKATADRADNNVDNGIADPISGITSVVVSDGKLFSLVITSPTTNAITINRVDPSTAYTGTVPPDPNGSYSLTVSAVATDRQGNPVPVGTPIRFGAVDAPLVPSQSNIFGTFAIYGGDGNPQEGGTLFTAPTGHFTTAAGGAGPGDTVLVFGDLVNGNRDLESARTVQTVNSAASLAVSVPFNLNDDTGHSVDYGPVLPYVIGRATEANIGAVGTTDSAGVASVKLNYPVSRLGKPVYVFAQGDGVATGTINKKVTDIAGLVFAGVAPAHLTVNPSSIPGNREIDVTVCAYDDLGSALQGATISFAFGSLGVGSGTVDGTSGAGNVGHDTGSDGCVLAHVKTSGIANDGKLTFSLGGATAEVTITASGNLILLASPSSFVGAGGTVTLTLKDSSGNPVAGVQLTGTCTASSGATVGLSNGPGITNASGQTTVVIVAQGLDQPNAAGSGTCVFTTPTGTPTATVNLTGTDICKLQLSPPPTGCNTTTQTFTLTVNLTASAATGGTVVSSPSGLNCTIAPGGAQTQCQGTFTQGTSVQLSATTNPAGGTKTFSGSCSAAGVVTMSQAQTCNVTFGP